ncbi:MAG: SRPBCC domain-containing protein [Flavobacteriales bacterium]|jgi:uncharacterized protein YndB with AHSA1/START domain|nr:SRPBCC domain-containing protein [Flavobacteriales bacterium]MDG1220306.1 START-like domain-containing protein [Schleiferiaceae bacterium]NCF57416.1 SRPBCC domain-containing protein [Bacteroidota bacterium]NCG44427.1 SRPBCC domain-containing protein [Pseudomonadota bacterium]MBT3571978.1 SRPBCC domain-containing protein [Flavobacteriales bacterium]
MSDREIIDLEFPVRSSEHILFSCLSTPSGLSEWFCDDVNSRGETFSFFWDGSEEVAKLVKSKKNTFIQFKWESDEGPSGFSFEFRIETDELTGDTLLRVTDHVESDEVEEMKLLWTSQVASLLRHIGG